MTTDIRSMTMEELTEYLTGIGQKKFRARQMYEWMHRRFTDSYDEMTDLPAALRSRLEKETTLCSLQIADVRTSALDGTQKYLFRLEDGNVIESVLMHYHHGSTVCISSQVGCRMGCRFCASTIGGRVRNMTASEMLGQIYAISRHTGIHISHVVVMGTGEPLDNYDQLLRFIRLLTDENGQHLSARNITVSTCGIVENIRRLADEQLQITLALSLHASNQQKREALMPIALKYDLTEVLDACRYYFSKTGRRLTFEYSLVAGVNDSQTDADELARLVKNMNCHINLIPVNPVSGKEFTAPDHTAVLNFQHKLEKRGLQVTIRREMGRDISGACGQLRRSYLDETNYDLKER